MTIQGHLQPRYGKIRMEVDSALWLVDPTPYASTTDCAAAFGVGLEQFNELPNLYAHYTPELRLWGPRLLHTPPDSATWAMCQREAVASHSASLFICRNEIERVIAHLRALIKLPQPDGSRLLFRFQDPVVIAHLLPLLDQGQVNRLLGPIEKWLVYDVCGQPVVGECRRGNRAVAGPLRLTDRQMGSLADRLLPASIISQANSVDSTLLGELTKCEQWTLLRGRVDRAKRQGLSADDDISLYCLLSLQLPEGFDVSGPVARALDRCRSEGIGFGTAIDDVPAAEWREWDEVLDAIEEGSKNG